MSPIIQLKNLSYAYPTLTPDHDPVWVLDGVDLSVESGEFIAVMGITGGGKSTLCLAFNGIVPHSLGGTIGGEVLINSLNSKQQTVADLSQTVGLVFQRPETQLFNMTVEAEIAFGLETLGLPPAEIEQRIDWALDIVGMTGFRPRSPFELSGGQKQRIAIAAILALKPPVLVLDEPTANLDPVGKREVFAAVDRLRQQEGITIIMVSHESEQIAAFADRVVVIDAGKIATDGPPSTVFSPAIQLQNIGLNVPQVSQLADQLNDKFKTNLQFAHFEDGVEKLQKMVTGQQLAFKNEVVSPESPSSLNNKERDEKKERTLFSIQDLAFHYSGGSAALKDVSLQIHEGDFVAVLGQNGSGKTTLVKHLNGLLRPSHGRVWFNQKDVSTLSIAELARSIGFVFQNPDHMIFSPTVREEIAAGPQYLGLSDELIGERVEQMLTLFDLHQYADLQPALLSFGLRRKVSVAAVVAMQTTVLILDEPTSGLDQRSTAEMMKLLGQLHQQGRTIIMITHDMNVVAEHIPSVVLMHAGQNIFGGTTENLFAQPGLLQKTGLDRPQITELGQRLKVDGILLTVDAFMNQIRIG
ncbi:MAG: energy-coupling factor transporter ATP-binding protein EcfA2 [Cellvibrionaceae bacterium]